MSTKEELIQRWDGFLEKMKKRYLESLEQAKEACMAQLEETDYDYYTVFGSWQGMKAQIEQLPKKIDKTWDKSVRKEMKKADHDKSQFYNDEETKRRELTDYLYEYTNHFEIELEGELSQAYFNHAIQLVQKNFNCSQCTSPLSINEKVYRAQYVTCPSCNTVNTFEPETKIATIGWNIIDNIIKLKFIDKYNEVEDLAEKITATPIKKQTDELWNSYKTIYTEYWETFFKERITLKADAEKRYDADVERKQNELKQFEDIQRYEKFKNPYDLK